MPWKILKHRIVRGLSGKIAVHYYTHWDETKLCTWEHEEELAQYGNIVMMMYWTGDIGLVGGENAKYRRYRVQFATRAEARVQGGRHVPDGFKVCEETMDRPRIYDPDIIIGSYIYYKMKEHGWLLGKKVVMLARDAACAHVLFPHTVKFLDLGRQENVHLSLANLTIIHGNEEEAWCWHVHKHSKSVKSFRYTLE